jgi:hypothetical protein
VLSLAVLCRHVALQDPGKPVGCSYPVLHRPYWPSTFSDSLGASITLHPPILVEEIAPLTSGVQNWMRARRSLKPQHCQFR